MKKNVTYVSYAALLALVEASGLAISEKANWLKVMGASGRRLYVPKCKSVGRVDLVGFADDEPGTVPAGEYAHGSVTRLLDQTGTEAEVLARLGALLDRLREMPAAEPKPRKAVSRAPQAPAPVDREARRAERLARLRSVHLFAKGEGKAVSASSPLLCADEDVTQEDIDAVLAL